MLRLPSFPARLAAVAFLAAVALAPASGVQIEDQLDVVHVDRRLLGIDSKGDRVVELDLELGERVLDTQARGLIGVVQTSERLLGLTTRHANWQELRYHLAEAVPPAYSHLGDRLALVVLDDRVVALSSRTTGWITRALGPGERALRTVGAANVGAIVTHRRAIAFAARSPGFVEIALTPKERVERVSLQESSVTLITNRRILVFREGSPNWIQRVRSGA